ncbi:PIN domain-containing protein [Roseofilum sp. Guam]|uniref:PIN domain-containing protein n=1 Tax=Roseofilum sp. Guam TaxID=2821502 RepID=UPI001B075EFE|nr:PIN domain-containing protein [Roseofilum sp. Guam]MBP0029509.1 PIN domain-containing protein [Roseofilum sp. Guam]
MKVYLDSSVLNRPFDDQTQALRTILQLIENQQLILISSSILDYENNKNNNVIRQDWVNQCLELAIEYQIIQPNIIERGDIIEQTGVKPIDALHLASAEQACCDVFLTCDDRLLRRYQGPIKAINPVNFILELTESPE